MSGYSFLTVIIFPPSTISRPTKPTEDDTKLDAFGVELSTHIHWLLPVSLLVVGILAIIYIAVKKFLEYDFPTDGAAATTAHFRHREPFLKRVFRYLCCGRCRPKQLVDRASPPDEVLANGALANEIPANEARPVEGALLDEMVADDALADEIPAPDDQGFYQYGRFQYSASYCTNPADDEAPAGEAPVEGAPPDEVVAEEALVLKEIVMGWEAAL
ncbi:hypothetical protein V8E54_006346 [Elaphomyces granulatus]